MTEAPPRTMKWLDLAEYGLQLVMMRLPSSTCILVLGGGSRYPKQAQALGFAKDAKTGFYTQTLRNLDIVAWRRQFPKVMVKDMALERSEEHTSELQSLMRISYAVFCLKKNRPTNI